PYQFAPRTWNAIRRLPLGVRQLMVKLLNGLPMPAKAFKLLRVLPSKDRQNFYHILMTHWQNSLQIVVGSKQNPTIFNTQNHWPQASSFEEWMMAIDANQYMIDDILVKVDRSAMANSLETRVPMLDHRVVELAWRFPLNLKIRDGVGKWILRQLLYRYVPKNLIERPKKGFSIPLAHWLRGPLRDWAESLISEDRLLTENFLNAQIVRKTWNEHISGKRDHANRLWNVLMFQAWLENK
ncbi:MAG: asparagine synthase, partial [Leptonema sp. (in: Bacteria)]|nr:asparagine synthase [Leptonema sp. (in: bacteria)]